MRGYVLKRIADVAADSSSELALTQPPVASCQFPQLGNACLHSLPKAAAVWPEVKESVQHGSQELKVDTNDHRLPCRLDGEVDGIVGPLRERCI